MYHADQHTTAFLCHRVAGTGTGTDTGAGAGTGKYIQQTGVQREAYEREYIQPTDVQREAYETHLSVYTADRCAKRSL